MEIREIEEGEHKRANCSRVFVEAILMANGEVVRYGKSLGFEKRGIYIEDI